VAEIEIYTTAFCPFFYWAKQLLDEKGVAYTEIDVMMKSGAREQMTERAGGNRKVPQIFVDGEYLGDCDELRVLEADGRLDAKLGIG
jgi:glutaredoxin 3